MLNFLGNYEGPLTVNGIDYSSVKAAIADIKDFDGQLNIKINKPAQTQQKQVQTQEKTSAAQVVDETVYRIKVRQYMIKPSSADFDFHDKWNKGAPMPMRVMVGRKIKETKGMVQMELWGEITQEQTAICMKCGKTLTNPVSRYFGIGPECGGHNYTNPFETEQELADAVGAMNEKLKDTIS